MGGGGARALAVPTALQCVLVEAGGTVTIPPDFLCVRMLRTGVPLCVEIPFSNKTCGSRQLPPHVRESKTRLGVLGQCFSAQLSFLVGGNGRGRDVHSTECLGIIVRSEVMQREKPYDRWNSHAHVIVPVRR